MNFLLLLHSCLIVEKACRVKLATDDFINHSDAMLVDTDNGGRFGTEIKVKI